MLFGQHLNNNYRSRKKHIICEYSGGIKGSRNWGQLGPGSGFRIAGSRNGVGLAQDPDRGIQERDWLGPGAGLQDLETKFTKPYRWDETAIYWCYIHIYIHTFFDVAFVAHDKNQCVPIINEKYFWAWDWPPLFMREQSGLQIPDPDDDVTGLKKKCAR